MFTRWAVEEMNGVPENKGTVTQTSCSLNSFYAVCIQTNSPCIALLKQAQFQQRSIFIVSVIGITRTVSSASECVFYSV